MSSLTRAQKKKMLDHILEMAKLNEEEQNYVMSKIIDMEQLVVIHATGKIDNVIDDMAKLMLVPRLMVAEAAEYVQHHK